MTKPRDFFDESNILTTQAGCFKCHNLVCNCKTDGAKIWSSTEIWDMVEKMPVFELRKEFILHSDHLAVVAELKNQLAESLSWNAEFKALIDAKSAEMQKLVSIVTKEVTNDTKKEQGINETKS